MATPEVSGPRWITVRLGEDFNWWLRDTSTDLPADTHPAGVLDPRQVAHLLEAIGSYLGHGLSRRQIATAFQSFRMESEVDEGVLRLAATSADLLEEPGQLFAVPRIDEEGAGPYYDFLNALSSARVRLLNATHQYARACTEDEMQDELDTLESDRYFGAETMHPFDELNEILEWSPAEWDESSLL